MSRLDAITKAARPKMHGRALLSGPSGAGKTWTALSMAALLAEAEGEATSVLTIDTERESALTYADVFAFDHLPWRPPYDPGELAAELDKLGDRYHVVVIDSLSHFWRGPGGTLDIADGRIGGWKAARPVQDSLVQALLAVPAHLLLCVRSKMDYLVGDNGRTVTRQGMAAIQDDTLIYEVNVAFDIDMEHRISVIKSRTVAVPVGRMYPAGMERKAAEDYAEWLAGGVPPAARADVDQVVDAFSQIVDRGLRKLVKDEFVERFGMPHSLTADSVVDAHRWLAERLATIDTHAAASSGPSLSAEVAADVLAMAEDEVTAALVAMDGAPAGIELPGEAELPLLVLAARWLVAAELYRARADAEPEGDPPPIVHPEPEPGGTPAEPPEPAATPPLDASDGAEAQPPPDGPAGPQAATQPAERPDGHGVRVAEYVAGLDKRGVVSQLGALGLATTGGEAGMRKRLRSHLDEHPELFPANA